MPRRQVTATQLSIPEHTEVEMEHIPGCRGNTAVVLITPTTNGAMVAVPASVERHEVVVEDGTGLIRVTLWLAVAPRSREMAKPNI